MEQEKDRNVGEKKIVIIYRKKKFGKRSAYISVVWVRS